VRVLALSAACHRQKGMCPIVTFGYPCRRFLRARCALAHAAQVLPGVPRQLPVVVVSACRGMGRCIAASCADKERERKESDSQAGALQAYSVCRAASCGCQPTCRPGRKHAACFGLGHVSPAYSYSGSVGLPAVGASQPADQGASMQLALGWDLCRQHTATAAVLGCQLCVPANQQTRAQACSLLRAGTCVASMQLQQQHWAASCVPANL